MSALLLLCLLLRGDAGFTTLLQSHCSSYIALGEGGVGENFDDVIPLHEVVKVSIFLEYQTQQCRLIPKDYHAHKHYREKALDNVLCFSLNQLPLSNHSPYTSPIILRIQVSSLLHCKKDVRSPREPYVTKVPRILLFSAARALRLERGLMRQYDL